MISTFPYFFIEYAQISMNACWMHVTSQLQTAKIPLDLSLAHVKMAILETALFVKVN